MPAIAPPAKVLVTGANGYIGTWIVQTLLDRGFSVRGVVRAEKKTTHQRRIFKDAVESGKLEFVIIPDMLPKGAFDEAVKGIDAIIHTASPVHLNADHPDELIVPAVNLTVNILEAAKKNGGSQLKRVVITSSGTAVFSPTAKGQFDEKDFNESSPAEVREKGRAASQMDKYFASKALAEKAVWEFVAANKSSISWDVATIIPPYVFGPILHEVSSVAELNSSSSMFYDAFIAKDKKLPLEFYETTQCEWVDVRDVALGHVRALEVPESGGKRFIVSSGLFVWQDFFDAAKELKLTGIVLPETSGKNVPYDLRLDNKRARTVLGMEFRDISTLTKDTVEDLTVRNW